MKLFSIISVCFGLMPICFAVDTLKDLKEFSPKLLRIKINDKILYVDGKSYDIKVKVKNNKVDVQYIFQNTGNIPAKVEYKVFIHLCASKDTESSKVTVGDNFQPEPATVDWAKGQKLLQRRVINVKNADLGQKLFMFIGMFTDSKGRIKLENKGVDSVKRLLVGTVIFE